MQLQRILNHVEPLKSFVYGQATLDTSCSPPKVRVQIRERANGRPECSGCGKKRPGYDRLPEREFGFVPLWGMMVLWVYAMRRVACPQCGIRVEQVPWGDGKCQQTRSYRLFLARWAKRLPWQEVARIFNTSWDSVYRAVRFVVSWGVVHRDESGIVAIGIDEIQWKHGHRFVTLVYQIDSGSRRLLWIGRDRTEKTLHGFFDLLGSQLRPTLRYVCSDMWSAYLTTVAERAGFALHILDRFHVMANMNKAIDEVRRAEVRQLKADGYEPILTRARWCLLKRRENLTDKETVKLSDLLKYNLKSVRAHLLREEFQRFWSYRSAAWAQKFLRQWCTQAMRSRLEPMKKVARSLRRHEALLLNWFRAKGTISSGIVEGLNNKAKVTMRKSYGFRNPDVLETVLYHNLGDLPEPESAHKFC